MNEKKLLEMDLADVITDKPHAFRVGKQRFFLYPMTLGKIMLVSGLIETLEISQDNIKANPYLEAIRCAKEHKDTCCKILAYHTTRTKMRALDFEFIEKRTRFFRDNVETESLASVMILLLSWDKTSQFIKHLGIDKERQRMERALKVKKSQNSITFGGQSIYGSLIDTACERYGWTFDYVVWEISFTNLRLLLADTTKQVYLTDEEQKRAHITQGAMRINGDDPKAIREYIKSLRK